MLRIHFTPQDLLRLRFLAHPAPLVELNVALMMLRRQDVGIFDHWRRRLRRAFPRDALPLLQLVFADSGPEYLDSLSPDFSKGLDAVLSSSPSLIRLSYDGQDARRPVTPWLRQLAEGERDAQQILRRALQSAYDAVLGALWRRALASFRTDLSYRTHTLLTQGIGPALATVFPDARWHGDVLEIAGRQGDIHLDGEGMTLLPTAFWTGRPMLSRSVPGRSLLVVYPARIPLPLIDDSHGDPARSLAALIGGTRAAVLEAISTTPASSTSQLAHRLGISPGRASEHTSVLRGAGLITSYRHRNSVLHTPTQLGISLHNESMTGSDPETQRYGA